MEHEGDLSDWSMSMYRYLECRALSIDTLNLFALTLIQLDLIRFFWQIFGAVLLEFDEI